MIIHFSTNAFILLRIFVLFSLIDKKKDCQPDKKNIPVNFISICLLKRKDIFRHFPPSAVYFIHTSLMLNYKYEAKMHRRLRIIFISISSTFRNVFDHKQFGIKILNRQMEHKNNNKKKNKTLPHQQVSFFLSSYVVPLTLICLLYMGMLARLWKGAPGCKPSAESRYLLISITVCCIYQPVTIFFILFA